MRKIALEEHFIPPGVSDYLKELHLRGGFAGASRGSLDNPRTPLFMDVGEGRIADMDKNGIDVMVLSLVTGESHTNADAARSVSIAKHSNDFLARRVQAHPGRFEGFAFLPLEDAKEAAREFERAVTQLNFKGAMVGGHILGEYLDAPKFWPLWELAEALDAPIYLHPANYAPDEMKILNGYPGLIGPGWSWTIGTASHALRILGSGVFDAFPKATLILGHMGESLPYQLHRLDQGWEGRKARQTAERPGLKKKLSQYIKDNVVITTSGNHSNEALACAIAVLGADRVLFSADYPPLTLEEMVGFIDNAPLSDIDRAKICHLNAERLLKIAPQASASSAQSSEAGRRIQGRR